MKWTNRLETLKLIEEHKRQNFLILNGLINSSFVSMLVSVSAWWAPTMEYVLLSGEK